MTGKEIELQRLIELYWEDVMKIRVFPALCAMIALVTFGVAFAGEKSEMQSDARTTGKNAPVSSVKSATTKSEVMQYGKAVDHKAIVTIADVLAKPEKYTDQPVTIEGIITQGCHHAGRWVRITDDDKSIDVYCQDVDWSFPTDHKGMHAVAMGKIVLSKIEGDELKAHIEHQNSEHEGSMKIEDYPDGLQMVTMNAMGAELSPGKSDGMKKPTKKIKSSVKKTKVKAVPAGKQ